jgi:hypothetical protein
LGGSIIGVGEGEGEGEGDGRGRGRRRGRSGRTRLNVVMVASNLIPFIKEHILSWLASNFNLSSPLGPPYTVHCKGHLCQPTNSISNLKICGLRVLQPRAMQNGTGTCTTVLLYVCVCVCAWKAAMRNRAMSFASKRERERAGFRSVTEREQASGA